MKLVIDITDEMWQAVQDGWVGNELWHSALKNGTPLPKGHGRIADMDEAIKCIEDVEGEDAIWAISLIKWACSKRTLIEADKAESEVEE